MGEEAAIRMCGRHTAMEADLLEIDRADPAGGFVDLLQPSAKAEEDYAASLEPTRLELDRAAGDRAVGMASRWRAVSSSSS